MMRAALGLLLLLTFISCSEGAPQDEVEASAAGTSSLFDEEQLRFVGTWRLDLPEEYVELAEKRGDSPPFMEIAAHSDGTWDMTGAVDQQEMRGKGTFSVVEDIVTLVASDGPNIDEPMRGELSVDGDSFVDGAGSKWIRVEGEPNADD